MTELNIPYYNFKIKSENNKKLIFDSIRKKYVVLTPEEWVRQNFTKHLINEFGYPESLISIEQKIVVNNLTKRCDIIAHNKQGNPLLVVECKAPEVKISQKTFDQIAVYNMSLKVNYLVVTNGITHYCCSIDHEKCNYSFLKDIPLFNG